MRNLLACAAVALSLHGTPAAATVDYTDMWFNANESGWGANLVRQGDILFMSLFVYDANGEPTFFTASDMRLHEGQVFKGKLYRTRGPHFAKAFSASEVTVQEVGEARIAFAGPDAAQLSYTVGSVVVTKDITRLGWAKPLMTKSGQIAMALTGTGPEGACLTNSRVGGGPGRVSMTATTFDLSVDFDGITECRLSGPLTGAGKYVAVQSGTYVCTHKQLQSSVSAPATVEDIRVQDGELTATMSFTHQGCTYSGALTAK